MGETVSDLMRKLEVGGEQEEKEEQSAPEEQLPCGLATCANGATRGNDFCSKTCSLANRKINKRRNKKATEELETECSRVKEVPGYRLEEVPGKGLGLVAARNLEPGDILFTEEPLIVQEEGTHPARVLEAFSMLSDVLKKSVLGLYDPKKDNIKSLGVPEGGRKIIRIFEVNCIALCTHEDFGIKKSGLYATISRVNHSCSPNVVWSWLKKDKTKRTKQVRVVRRIEAGEEICSSYLTSDNFPKKEERRQLLQNWFPACLCRLCGLSGRELRENEAVREELRELHRMVLSLAEWNGFHGARRAICASRSVRRSVQCPMDRTLEAALKKVQLMETIQDEMVIEVPGALMNYCELAALLRKKGAREKAFQDRSRKMAALFGDCFIYSHKNKCAVISSIV